MVASGGCFGVRLVRWVFLVVGCFVFVFVCGLETSRG